MKKSYYRRWILGTAIGSAYLPKKNVAYALGIPRYKLRKLLSWAIKPFSFEAQLEALDCVGSLYGVWFK
jgi:hypothetical protein